MKYKNTWIDRFRIIGVRLLKKIEIIFPCASSPYKIKLSYEIIVSLYKIVNEYRISENHTIFLFACRKTMNSFVIPRRKNDIYSLYIM